MVVDTPLHRRVAAVVPIRAGSKGFPGKNLAELAGRPLYRHAIDQAIAAGAETVVVTTDIESVISTDHGPRVVVHRRPKELATDSTPMAAVLTDVLARPEFEDGTEVLLLQATSPLRTPDDLRAALAEFRSREVDLLLSACAVDSSVLKYGTIEDGRFKALRDPRHPFTNRQELPPVYRPNGAIYVFRADWFRERGSLATDSIGVYLMRVEDSIDVDTMADLERCARRLEERERNSR